MTLLGSALALLPKFNWSYISLAEWEERLESAAPLYQVPTLLNVKLAINSLDDPKDRASLEQILAGHEGLFGENVTIPELRRRSYVLWQQEDQSLTHFVVALQNPEYICLRPPTERPVCGGNKGLAI